MTAEKRHWSESFIHDVPPQGWRNNSQLSYENAFIVFVGDWMSFKHSAKLTHRKGVCHI